MRNRLKFLKKGKRAIKRFIRYDIPGILKGKRSITADTALRLSLYFGTSPKFWLGLQDDYDIEEENKSKKEVFKRIKRMRINAPQSVA